MVALTDFPNQSFTAPGPASSRHRRHRRPWARWIVLCAAGVYFIVPLIAAIIFTVHSSHTGVTLAAYQQIFAPPSAGQTTSLTAIGASFALAVVTIVLSLLLMLPTQLLIHLRIPTLRGIVEVLALLPLVFPPVVLVVGIDSVYSWVGNHEGSVLYTVVSFLRDPGHPLILSCIYVILSMPFVYRSLDGGIRSIDAQTLMEASRNLGASSATALFRVIMPALRSSVISASFLCFTLVMGEFTISSILLYTKLFPVWLEQIPQASGQSQVAVSVFSLVLVEAILLIISALTNRQKKVIND